MEDNAISPKIITEEDIILTACFSDPRSVLDKDTKCAHKKSALIVRLHNNLARPAVKSGGSCVDSKCKTHDISTLHTLSKLHGIPES